MVPGNADQCRINAARYTAVEACMATGSEPGIPSLAEIYSRLAAEIDADGNLYRTLCDIDLSVPHDALPRALNIRSWAAYQAATNEDSCSIKRSLTEAVFGSCSTVAL